MTAAATFMLDWSAEERVFTAAMFGFWSEADVARFGTELARVVALAAGLGTFGLRRMAFAGAGPLLARQA